jgi:hypothetical protein
MIPKQLCSEPSLISLSHNDDRNDAPLIQLTRDPATFSSSTVFGWSDIPCQGDDPMQCAASLTEEYYYHHGTPPSTTAVNTMRPEAPMLSLRRISIPIFPPVVPLPRSLCSQPQIPSLPPSPRSTMQCDDVDSPTTTTITITRKTVSIEANGTITKQVSFAPTVRVRTHTVTVGDHPCCTGGMALTCGWESIDSIRPLRPDDNDDAQCKETALVQKRWSCWQSSSSSCTLPPSPPLTTKRVRRSSTMMDWHLSYEARRQRLQEVTGWAESQLLWEEYRLARGGGDGHDNQDKVLSISSVMHSTLNEV